MFGAERDCLAPYHTLHPENSIAFFTAGSLLPLLGCRHSVNAPLKLMLCHSWDRPHSCSIPKGHTWDVWQHSLRYILSGPIPETPSSSYMLKKEHASPNKPQRPVYCTSHPSCLHSKTEVKKLGLMPLNCYLQH